MYTEINEDYVWEILRLSQEMFDSNLYVKCNIHPCGWDRIDLDGFEYIDDKVRLWNINYGIYDSHPFGYKTLYEIIGTVGMNGWSFVQPTICPDDLRTVGI